MTKSRIFLFLLLAFLAGVSVRSFVSVPPVVIWGMFSVSAVFIAVGTLRKNRKIVIYSFFVIALGVGVLRFDQVEQKAPDLSLWLGKPLLLHGVVAEDPEFTDIRQRLKVRISSLDTARVKPKFYTLVTLRRYPKYEIGDDLKIQGVLERPTNYGDFDYVAYLARQDIASVMSFPLIEKTGQGSGSKLMITLSQTKHAFEEKIDRILSEPHAALLKGLLLGERSSLPPNLVEDFKRTGTSHIVALSGYNITIVGGFFIAGLVLLSVPFRVSFWLASAGIVLFILMVGASPSVVRAGIMGILVLIAQREGRVYHMTNALVLAAAAMVFYEPRLLRFDAAFQLSFLATVGLVYLSPFVEKYLDRLLRRSILPKSRKQGLIKKTFIETVSAQLMVLPLLIYSFGRVSLISPFTNILVLVAVPYAMVAGFVAGFLSFLWQPLGQIAGWIAWLLLEYQLRVIEIFAGLPFVSLEVGKWAVFPLLAVYLRILWVFWKKDQKKMAQEKRRV